MQTTTEQLHIAAQYLTAASKSFVPTKADDSHTNLGWNHQTKSLETRDLNPQGLRLTLNHEFFSLDVTHPKSGVEASFPLEGATHLDTVAWIGREMQFCGIDTPFEFDLHFDLPYIEDFDDQKFTGIDEKEAMAIGQLRWMADKAVQSAQNLFSDLSDVRVWPHHFDSGALGTLKSNPDISIGLGLSIPDNLSDTYYFYVSGYKGEKAIDTAGFPSLDKGKWLNDGWKGALLQAEGVSIPVVGNFLMKAISAFDQ